MNVFCQICGMKWDSRDPGVRYLYGDDQWECYDEGPCFERHRALNVAFGSMPPARPVR